MKKLLPLLAALWLAACAGGRPHPSAPAIYDFGPGGAPATATVAALRLDVRLPVWLDSSAMHYRLLYADPQRLHAYAEARWAASPARLLRQRLRQFLPLADGAVCTLRLEIDDFSQVFASASASQARFYGSASLYGAGGELLWRDDLALQIAAPGADAASGVRALASSVDTAGQRIAAGLNSVGSACPAGQ